MDQASLDLIFAIQLEDLANIRDASVDDSEPNNIDDTSVALDAYRKELLENASVLRDRQLGDAIGKAREPDHQPISDLASATPTVDQILTNRFQGLKPFGDSTYDGSFPENAKNPLGGDLYRAGRCVVCTEYRYDLMGAPCDDLYCKSCIGQLFDHSISDESLFPPRCCREAIPLDSARPFLTRAKATEFKAKSLELSTKDRTYCNDKSCARFIPPDKIEGEKATCEICNLVTCTVCKSLSHEGECPEDPAHETFILAAKAAGFQKCYQCNRMVELNFGCNHIT